MFRLILIILILGTSTVQAHQWKLPPNDQRGADTCKFSDYSTFAFVVDVYDADTITVYIDLGHHMFLIDRRVRFYDVVAQRGVDADEIRTKDLSEKRRGLQSRNWLREQILDKWVVLTTYKDKSGKFGRLIGSVCRDGIEYTAKMLAQGRLRYRDY